MLKVRRMKRRVSKIIVIESGDEDKHKEDGVELLFGECSRLDAEAY